MEMTTLTDPSGWRRTDVRARDEWIVGLDVGQSIDPSAVCALSRGNQNGPTQ
jgi:hypothetical protein